MSDLKERLMKEFSDSYENSYQAFNEFVEDKIIKNHGVYIMDKIDYYHYCNEVKENNSAKRYLKRAKRFIGTIINLPSGLPFCVDFSKVYKRIEHERIDCTGKPNPSSCLKYCIKRFCKEHEDCIVYLYDYKKLYFQMIIDWLKGGRENGFKKS